MLRKKLTHFTLTTFFFSLATLSLIAEDNNDLSGTQEIFKKLGTVIDGKITLTDSDNKSVSLHELSEGKKVIVFSLNYFKCKDICSFQLKDMKEKIPTLGSDILDKTLFLSISFDFRDTYQDAKIKEDIFNKDKKLPWKFLVGSSENSIQKLSQAINFYYNYDKEEDVFAHGAGLFFLSCPDLTFKRYLYGIIYKPEDLRKAIYDTSHSSIGSFFDRMKLFMKKTFQKEYGRYKDRF